MSTIAGEHVPAGRAGGGRGPGLRAAALTAGTGLLVMAALAFPSSTGVNGALVEGNAAATAANIAEHQVAFRLAMAGLAAVALLDVVVACALYLLLRPVHRRLAMLAAGLRIGYAVAFVALQSHLMAALRWASDPAARAAVGRRQADGDALAALHAFTDGWMLALVIFGVHLLVVGLLVGRAAYLPAVLGVLVGIGGLGYVVDGLARVLWRGHDVKLSSGTFVGEVALMVWLLWRGGRLASPTSADRDGAERAVAR